MISLIAFKITSGCRIKAGGFSSVLGRGKKCGERCEGAGVVKGQVLL